jgi:hypothetical protein
VKTRRLAASCVVAACALVVSLTAQAPSSSSPQDLARALAQRVASVVAPLNQVLLVPTNPQSRHAADEAAVLREIADQLRARGLSLVSAASGAAKVRVACSENLRDHVCAAEIVKGDSRDVVAASRPRALAAAQPSSRLVTLDVRPVLAQRERILDLVEIGDRLLVLDVAGFDLYLRSDTGWKPAGTVAVASPPARPRDPRGRLSVNGERVDAFLPGMTCRCTLEPFKADCVSAQNSSWPVGAPNSILAPGANYFTSPNTPPFFTAAQLGTEAGLTTWLLAGVDGRLHLLGAAFEARQTLPGLGDDVASVQTACGSGRQLIATGSNGDDEAAEALRAYEMTGSTLIPLTPAVHLPGRITAVWERPAGGSVLVVAHNSDLNRYEAFYVGLGCVR